jgi:glucose-1-phosphatase
MTIKAMIFDIGGVLMENPGKFWNGVEGTSELRDQFGIGRIEKNDFILRGTKLLNISGAEFEQNYNKAYSNLKINEEVLEIYTKIALPKYILSDTNETHVKLNKINLDRIFESSNRVFLSHEIHMRKTDDETFDYVVSEIGVNRDELVFVDDKSEYIDRANRLGIHGILFKDYAQLSLDLIELGVKMN